MFGNKVYELPLARDYVSRWGVVEAVRELLQNAIDSPSPFEVKQVGSILTIMSRGARLEPSTLVLGRTSKADDTNSIGQFGEGYKLALLVLTREGKACGVVSGNVFWRPEFRMSPQFGIETLHIVEERLSKEEAIDGVRFIVHNLDGDEQAAIKGSCLLMQDMYPDTIHTQYGEILPNLPGKLFVGGLFVCNTSLHYGYNFNPGELPLERDRQTVADFELKWKTKDVWLSTLKYDLIAELIDKGIPDLENIQYSAPEILKEACYRHFVKEHPGKVIAKDQKEMEELVKRGMTVYIGGSVQHAMVSGAKSYRESKNFIPEQTPQEALTEWFDENHKYMPRIPATAFKRLLVKAEKWRIGT